MIRWSWMRRLRKTKRVSTESAHLLRPLNLLSGLFLVYPSFSMVTTEDTNLISPLGMTLAEFTTRCTTNGIGSGKAKAAYKSILCDGRSESLPAKIVTPKIVTRQVDTGNEGTTIKFVQRLPNPDHRLADRGIDFDDIESVIIPMVGRSGTKTHTLCVSSQVGCALGCDFCETAQMGLIRSLSASEIVAQWWAARFIEGITIDNIVFMGMGEPMDNLDEGLKAIECQSPSPQSAGSMGLDGSRNRFRFADGSGSAWRSRSTHRTTRCDRS